MLAIVAIAVDRRNEKSDWSALLCRDFLERTPKRIFKADAGFVSRNQHSPFHNGRFLLRTFHVPTR